MKKFYYLLASSLLLIGAASCEKELKVQDTQKTIDVQDPESHEGKIKMIFGAGSRETSQAGQKTSLASNWDVLWSEGDKVKIYYTGGDGSADFTIVEGVGTTEGVFEGWVEAEATGPFYAVYPSTAAVGISGKIISFNIPAEQSFAENSFGNGSAVMAAYSPEDKNLAFKNLIGLLEVPVTGEGELASFKVESATKNVCGTYTVDATDLKGSITQTSGSKSISLSGLEGVELSSTPKTIYIAVVPNSYPAEDLTVTMTNTEGKEFVQKLGKMDIGRGGLNVDPVEPIIVADYGKCNASDYNTVTINGVVWMKENYACRKYDTDAIKNELTEAFKTAYKNELGEIVIPKAKPSTPTYKDTLRTPYYTDATDRNTWSQRTAAKKQQTSLSEAQVAKMGYLYNWAAAVGVNEDLLRTTDFTGKRQGICPNGWHVPSQTELDALKAYIEGAKGTDTAGSHLKSTSGWYNAGNPSKYPQGVDTYGFDLLPAGFSAGDSISNVGAAGHVLTATPAATRSYKFYYGYGSYTNKTFPTSDGAPRCNGRSLRCIKD